jgi:hypothetical protein
MLGREIKSEQSDWNNQNQSKNNNCYFIPNLIANIISAGKIRKKSQIPVLKKV